MNETFENNGSQPPSELLLWEEKLKSYISDIENTGSVSASDFEEAKQLLTDFECWEMLSKLLKEEAKNADEKRKLELYQYAAKAWGIWAHEPEKSAEIICVALDNLKNIDYETLHFSLISKSIESENYQDEATVLEKISEHSISKEILESCLERLAMIYDKKLHLDRMHFGVQQKLLALNPENHKSLKYFKAKYHQSGDWENVAEILETLIESSTHVQERARYAMELAVVLLFYLGDPDRCLKVIDKHVGENLNGNKVKLAALKESGRLDQAVEILERMLEIDDSKAERPVILYHYGQVLKSLKKYDLALEKFRLSYSEYPIVATLLEMTKTAILLKDVNTLLGVLEIIESSEFDELKSRAGKLYHRLRT